MAGSSAVLLDVGGVMLVPDHRVIGPILEPFGVVLDPATATRAHYAGVAALDREPPEPGIDYVTAYAAAARIPPSQLPAAVDELLPVWSRPSVEVWSQVVDGTVEGLRALAHAGYRLGIISNSDGTVETQLRIHRLCQRGDGPGVKVEVIADSHLVGFSKPAPEIFHWALEAMEVEADRAVFVGDSVRMDVWGSRSVGLEAVHFDPLQGCQSTDHRHVRSLMEVGALLDQEERQGGVGDT